MSSKIVIGMTGPFGSGCTYISREIIEKMGYEYISLSDILRSELGVTELSKNRLRVLHIMVILDSGRYYDEIMSKVR